MKVLILIAVFFSFALGELHREFFAHCNLWSYLDGPRRESLGARGIRTFVDSDENVWYLQSNFYGNLRCITKEGRVITITGNNYWLTDYQVNEGPASACPSLSNRFYGFGLPTGHFIVIGTPLKGEAYGHIYSYTDKKELVKIWKNSSQNGRWWFKKIVGGGSASFPTVHGQRVSALSVINKVQNVQIGPQDEIILFAGNGFFKYDTTTSELECLLGFDDYKDSVPKKTAQYLVPSEAYMDAAYAFYISYYYNDVTMGIYRISPNRDTVSLFTGSNGGSYDGSVITARYYCGPHMRPHRNISKWLPAGVLLPSDHDNQNLRRVKDGRVSRICLDGEWREFPTNSPDASPQWFHFDFSVGPNGTGYSAYLSPDAWGDYRMYKISGIDYTKPTVQ